MSHGDRVEALPEGFSILLKPIPPYVRLAANIVKCMVQFHPEVHHTPEGLDLLRNSVFRSQVGVAIGQWLTSWIGRRMKLVAVGRIESSVDSRWRGLLRRCGVW